MPMDTPKATPDGLRIKPVTVHRSGSTPTPVVSSAAIWTFLCFPRINDSDAGGRIGSRIA